jgi:DNA-binding MarR family transcriptional regulator
MHYIGHVMMSERDILDSCACHRVRTAARAVTRAYDEALRPVGLRATQLSVLVAIAADDALSITALAKLMGMDRSTLTRNLRPLETEGFIKLGLEGWRRSRMLEVTAKGRARLREAIPLWEKAQKALQRKLGDRSWDLIRKNLDDLIRAA